MGCPCSRSGVPRLLLHVCLTQTETLLNILLPLYILCFGAGFLGSNFLQQLSICRVSLPQLAYKRPATCHATCRRPGTLSPLGIICQVLLSGIVPACTIMAVNPETLSLRPQRLWNAVTLGFRKESLRAAWSLVICLAETRQVDVCRKLARPSYPDQVRQV